jgi:hypothetical protein
VRQAVLQDAQLVAAAILHQHPSGVVHRDECRSVLYAWDASGVSARERMVRLGLVVRHHHPCRAIAGEAAERSAGREPALHR